MKRGSAFKLTDLTADLTMVLGRMKRSARATDQDVVHPGTEYAILDTILRHDRRTVPEIAAFRGVARQSVQTVVNKLVDAGLIGLRDNPDHKSSSLLVVEEAGQRHYEEARSAMCDRYIEAEIDVSEDELKVAKKVIALIAQTWGDN